MNIRYFYFVIVAILLLTINSCQTTAPQSQPPNSEKKDNPQTNPNLDTPANPNQTSNEKKQTEANIAQNPTVTIGNPATPLLLASSDEPQPIPPLPMAPVASDPFTLPPPALDPSGNASAEEKLQSYIQNTQLSQEQQSAFVAHLIQSAKKQMARHDYVGARNFLDQALQIQPTHREAGELRHLVGSFLGEYQSQIATLNNIYENEVKVKIEQARLEAKNHYKNGIEAFNKKEYDQAIHELESALEIIKWAPYQLNLDTIQQESEKKIKEAKTAKEEWTLQQNEERMQEAQRRAEQLEAEEQAQRATQIRILLTRATEFYTQQRYEKADELVKEVIVLDPANKSAKRLQDDIRDASHSYISQKTLERRIEEWKLFLENMKESTIPTSELIKYPDKEYWRNVVEKREAQSRIGKSDHLLEEDSLTIRDIKNKLQNKTISINFIETPFEAVIRFIQAQAEINIVIDPKVIEKFEADNIKITLQVNNIKLQNALSILLQFHDLVYVFKDDVLFITFRISSFAKDKPIPILHDIRDLTGQIKDFPGPRIKLSGGGTSSTGASGATFEESESTTGTVITTEKLTELIKQSIDPESWEDKNQPYSIDETSGQLLVVHTEKVHEEIRSFLNELRRFSGMMVAIEARFLEVTDDFLEHIGVDWRGLGNDDLSTNDYTSDEDDKRIVMPAVTTDQAGGGSDNTTIDPANKSISPSAGAFFRQGKDSSTNTDNVEVTQANFDVRARSEHIDDQTLGSRLQKTGGLAIQLATLDDMQLSAVLWFIKKTGRAETLMAPRLTAFNTQRAHLTVVEQRSYIKDFDVEVAQSAYIADPVIGTIQSGVVLDVRPIISNDRKYITLELRPTIATLMEFRTFETTLGASGKTVTFEIPQIKLQSVETTVRIPDQGTLMLGGLKTYRNIDRKLDIPLLGNIPIISFFFSQQSKVDEKQDLLILVKARIIDLEEEEEKAVGTKK